MKNIQFVKTGKQDFGTVLKARVDQYFKSNGKSKYGNSHMMAKSMLMISTFFIPIVILCTGIVTSPWLLFALYITSGLGMAGIGMGVMHDAIHGSYSKNRTINKYMGYTMNLIGANARVWKIQHNVLHHTYTNIDEADDDINTPPFLRFSPFSERRPLHRFQYIYIWFFYGLSTISWITTKDFVRAKRYKSMGFFKETDDFRKELLSIAAWKALYYSYALALPIVMIPLPAWMIVLAFLSMHFFTGICISSVFQTAHIMPDASFVKTDEVGQVDSCWAAHQLATTSNYAPGSKYFSWLIGGLNYQIEHHLFPNICHVHYRNISPIVSETAREFNIPYHTKKNFSQAIIYHVKMLKQLGRA